MVKWKNIKPHSEKSRKTMKKKYGNSCFLDPRRMKYPICNKFNGKKECKGIYAADFYINIHRAKLLKKTKKNTDMKKMKYYNKLKHKSTKLKKKYCTRKMK